MVNDFPVETPRVILDPQVLKSVIIKDDHMYLNGKRIEGLIRGKFLPPQTLFPFLMTRLNEKSYAICCKSCLLENQVGICHHSDEKRAFVDSYTIAEMAYAVNSCGYKILQIYEILCYECVISYTFTIHGIKINNYTFAVSMKKFLPNFYGF